MPGSYWLVARDKPGLLIAMMRALTGHAYISFEGNLSRCDFGLLLPINDGLIYGLRRVTPYPCIDFVVLPLEPDTIRPILDQVLPGARVVHDIIHIQIAKHGRREFGAYDNFHPDCIVCGPLIPQSLLDNLQRRGVLRTYMAASENLFDT